MEILSLWVVIGCVYLSETLWWVASSSLVLSGSRIGEFRLQRGAALEVRDGKGFFFTWPLPPFRYTFECPQAVATDLNPTRAKRSHLQQRATQAVSLAKPLRLLGQGLWIYLFVVMPLTIAVLGLLVVWIPLLLVLLICLAAVVVSFRRSWQRLHPDKRSGWRPDAALMVLSPLGAVRAADRLTRSAFADVNGLYLASIVALPEEFCRVARLAYFDDASPMHAASRTEIERILDTNAHLRPLFEAPPSRDSGMLGFCQRCHAQVMRATGGCPDCVTQVIVPFDTDGERVSL